MNYFIFILFTVFPVYIFADDEDEKKENPPEIFILDQSRLDSGVGEKYLSPLREGVAEGPQEINSLAILGTYVAYRLENSDTQMEYWLGQLKMKANTGDVLALKMAYRITGEVLIEGYIKAVSSTIDSFFAEGREQGVSPKMTAMQNRESVRESVMKQIKAPFVAGVEGLMFDLYEGHQAKGNTGSMANWLGQLKKRANEGNVPALRIVYHITGEVLATGLNTSVGSAMNSLFTEGREQGVSPKMTAMQNLERVHNNIVKMIKTPFGRCEGGF